MRRRSRQRRHLVVVAVVLLLLGVGSALGLRWMLSPPAAERASAPTIAEPAGREPEATSLADRPEPQAVDAPHEGSNPVALEEDDGATLWGSPTAGEPLTLRGLPPGCQVFVAIRPAEVLSRLEGEKVVAALGPSGQLAIAAVERRTGMPIETIDWLLVGLRATATGSWLASYVVRPTKPEAMDQILQGLKATPHEQNGSDVFRVGDLAYSVETSADGPLLVITPMGELQDVLDLAGGPPPLRRDMEQLVAASDRDRHVTLLFAPNYLSADGKSLFDGVGQRLKKPLEWFLGDGLTAVALSMHWGDDFFLELQASATIDTRPHELTRELRQRIAELPSRVEEHVFNLQLSPYSRRLLARFPEMVRAAVRYTRCDSEQGRAVVRTYLPANAGHNLIMASELALVEPMHATPVTAPSAPEQNESIEDRLHRVTSLRFARDTLEAALGMLADDLGIAIELSGQDLQLEGITRNQSFGIDLVERPAGEILVEILRLANPDKAATGPDDPRQKLVYVVRTAPPAVLVTTRAAAARRKDTLPAVFAVQE